MYPTSVVSDEAELIGLAGQAGCRNQAMRCLPLSTDRAIDYVRRMVAAERQGTGDTDGALRRLARRYGIGFWTLSHLRKGNAKTCDTTVFAKLQAAYLDLCERQIAALQHEIASERAVSGDEFIEGLEAEAAALARKIAAQRGALK